MKTALIAITLALWAGYLFGHDKKPVPRWFHPAINIIYAGCLVAEAVLI